MTIVQMTHATSICIVLAATMVVADAQAGQLSAVGQASGSSNAAAVAVVDEKAHAGEFLTIWQRVGRGLAAVTGSFDIKEKGAAAALYGPDQLEQTVVESQIKLVADQIRAGHVDLAISKGGGSYIVYPVKVSTTANDVEVWRSFLRLAGGQDRYMLFHGKFNFVDVKPKARVAIAADPAGIASDVWVGFGKGPGG
jgi:hypothetical protein